jgi:hypothetical protein
MKGKDGSFYKRFDVTILLVSALLLKLFFIFTFKLNVYPDVIRAIEAGRTYFMNKEVFFINNKIFLGPLLWFFTYHHFGIWGLKIVNLASFILMFIVQYLIGRKKYSHPTTLIALFLFSFYVGTNLNIIAGEQDDNLATLLFSLGILFYLYRGGTFFPSLLMGIGFLFKFSTGIFYLGFALYLLVKRDWKGFLLSGIGMLLPFLYINFIDHFYSAHILLKSLGFQAGYSTWEDVYFKLFSTGMLFSFLISLWVFLNEKKDHNLLFFLLSSIYLLYVVVNRDVAAASFVMMQSIFFSSFLIGEFLIKNEYFGKGVLRRIIIGIVLLIYFFITLLITQYNLNNCTIKIYIFSPKPRVGLSIPPHGIF